MLNFKAGRNWLRLFSLNLIYEIIITILFHANILNGLLAGCLQISSLIVVVVYALKKNKIFTPLLPALILEFAFSLYTLQLVKSYDKFPLGPSILIRFCMYIWYLMTIAQPGFSGKNAWNEVEIKSINSSKFKKAIYPLFFVAVAMIFFEWYKAGGIPALRSDSETYRFNVSYSSITHILAIMNKIVAMLIGVYFISKEKISLRKDFFLIVAMCISELLMVGTSMRGEMITAPCIIFIAYALKHKIKTKYYIIAGVIGAAVIGAIPIIRMQGLYGTQYLLSQKSISTYPNLYWLTPLYQAFANNFEILKLDFSIFPDIVPFGLGAYGILPQIPFVDLGMSLSDIQNSVLNNGFYAALTGTFFATSYADFGYIGFIIITIFDCWICNLTYRHLLIKKDLFSLALYVYTLYNMMWIFYASTVGSVFLCYAFLIWFTLRTRMGSLNTPAHGKVAPAREYIHRT